MNEQYGNLYTEYVRVIERHEHDKKITRRLLAILIAWTMLKVARIALGFIPKTRFINKLIPWWLDVVI